MQHQKNTPVWIDLDEIHKKIDRSSKQSEIIDAAENDVQKAEETTRVKDLSEPIDSKNKFLKNLKGSKPKAFPKAEEDEGILLNFDNADIYEVIQVMAEALELNYIIDPQVKGVVNIRSGEKIPMDYLYDIFKKILNMNGLDIRSEGQYDYIYVAKKLTSPILYNKDDIGKLKDSPKIITQIAPIMNISSTEASKLIEPYLSVSGSVYDLADLNTIIITDFETKIIDSLVLLAQLDISPLSSLKVKLIKVNNAPLFDLSNELTEILSALKINKKDFDGVTVLPLERVNSILLLGNNHELLNNADKWIKELDVIPSQGRDTIYIYNVRNSVASELEELVSSLISEDNTSAKSSKAKTSTRKSTSGKTATDKPGQKSMVKAPSIKKKSSSSRATDSTLHFTGEPVLFADDSRNVILIRAMPSDYSRILKLLERLDNLPRQVLIEVIVAEVQLTDAWQFGVEWTLKNNPNIRHNDFTGIYDLETGLETASGITFSLLKTADDIRGLVNMVANDTHVSILSSPHVMVLNNETATINVGKEVPIATSQTVDSDITTNDTLTIQYRDTGIILTVTPRINYDGIIILDVEQQVSDVAEGATTAGINSPTINNREIKTKLAVKDGQPILMGGLIDTDQNIVNNGVPGFKELPLLGWLFKTERETTTKQELLIFITPYVIASESVLDQYIREFKKKMIKVRGDLRQITEMKHSIY